jgi:hypothetical protein
MRTSFRLGLQGCNHLYARFYWEPCSLEKTPEPVILAPLSWRAAGVSRPVVIRSFVESRADMHRPAYTGRSPYRALLVIW